MITFTIIVKITQPIKKLRQFQRISELTFTRVFSGNGNKLQV